MSKQIDIGGLSRVTLETGDISDCLVLSIAAGWNQTAADWGLQIELGNAVGLKNETGRLLATGSVLPLNAQTGWIAMILVDEKHRRQGLGQTIMKALISDPTWSDFALDATEQGKRLYESLGFESLETIVRYGLERDGEPVVSSRSDDSDDQIWNNQIQSALSRRSDVVNRSIRTGRGMMRVGLSRLHVGPVLATSEQDAADVVNTLLRESIGSCVIDIPSRAGTFTRRMEKLGFVAERSFVRMSRGGSHFVEPGTFALAGPEYS